jgi:hypothetical protein
MAAGVVDSRPAVEGASIRRRRRCGGCDFRFTTYELFVDDVPDVRLRSDGCVIGASVMNAGEFSRLLGVMSEADSDLLMSMARRLAFETPEEAEDRAAWNHFNQGRAA